MTCAALLELLRALDASGIEIWLDGGWGVDALLERQTRPHRDLDIFIRVTDVPRLTEVLARRAFLIERGSPPNSFVLADGAGLEVDVHAFMFDDAGNGIYRMENGEDWIFSAEAFEGWGIVGGMRVRCLSANAQMRAHAQGYQPAEKDFRDMELLSRHFGIVLPRQLMRDPT